MFPPLSTEATSKFYDALASGEEGRSLWGMEKRFSPEVAIQSPSFRSYFRDVLADLLDPSAKVIDVGCGTGMYHPVLAPLCGELTGVELSEKSAALARQSAEAYGLSGVSIAIQDSTQLAFPDGHFDAALCVDFLHHVFDLDAALRELARVVKPGGDIVVFEPNCLNPLLLLMCVLDRNEWAAASRCYRGKYERIFSRHFDRCEGQYNGLLIGPQGRLSLALAEFMLESPLAPLLRWMSPKLLFRMRNRA
ncbi:MAG: class I SAM-dependent methyltransferase [Deltaproteobacteria bacterium]|nr:class I SAM-dependent methyltransferase [Deltaproteobacteria bacterium]MBW2417824.1 class I SAM-dependent methyltransferase [Deltaproteobacteria bacterium]